MARGNEYFARNAGKGVMKRPCRGHGRQVLRSDTRTLATPQAVPPHVADGSDGLCGIVPGHGCIDTSIPEAGRSLTLGENVGGPG
jgi:hypothetical protein